MFKPIRKALLVGTILFAPMSSMAGFYVGADMGQDATGMDYKRTSTDTYEYTEALTGQAYGVFAGYQWKYNSFLLGAEADWHKTNSSYEFTDSGLFATSAKYKYEKLNDYSLDILPGWQVDQNNQVFGVIGYVNGQFKRTSDRDGQQYFGADFNQHSEGYELGLGTNSHIWKGLSLRARYQHQGFETIKNNPLGDNAVTANYTPSTDQFLMGFQYQFGLNQQQTNTWQLSNTQGWNAFYAGLAYLRDDTSFEEKTFLQFDGDTYTNSDWTYEAVGNYGQFTLGYGHLLGSRFYLGGEASLDAGRSQFEKQMGENKYYYYKRNGYSLSLKPGILLNQSSLLYVIGGYIPRTIFQKSGYVEDAAFSPNFDKAEHGWQGGIGTEIQLSQTNPISLVMEYDHQSYQEIKTSDEYANYSVTPSSNVFKMGLNIRFNV